MGLVFWWMLLIWTGLIAGFFVIRYLLKKRKRADEESTAIPIAHSYRLTNLPEYVAAIKQYGLLVRLAAVTMTVALLAAIILSARPASMTLVTPAQQSRDIMLCLDVSGSVLRADTKLVNRFSALVNGFTGQRFGMTVFNSSSISAIPLSDDYQFINEQLQKVSAALTSQDGQEFTDLTSGTLADFDKGTSLVSDGIGSCISDLGDNPQHRSQSIILATDNEANGTPIIDLTQAVTLAEQRNIRIYSIDPGESEASRTNDHAKLRSLSEQTGGGYYALPDANTVNAIINEISKQEAKYAASTPVVAVTDTPKLFMYIAIFATGASLVLAWRLQI
jgi:hypothetical protein